MRTWCNEHLFYVTLMLKTVSSDRFTWVFVFLLLQVASDTKKRPYIYFLNTTSLISGDIPVQEVKYSMKGAAAATA